MTIKPAAAFAIYKTKIYRMKKIWCVIALSLLVSLSFGQVQRQKKLADKADSTSQSVQKEEKGQGKKEMMKELGLSKEQRSKLKEFRQAAQSKKAVIENDESLKPEEKKAKLKELRKELQKNTMSVLSKEQKMKLLQMRNDKKEGDMEEMNNQ